MAISDNLTGAVGVAVCVIVVIKLYQIASNARRLRREFQKFPQRPSNPFLGHLLEYPGPNEAGYAYQRAVIAEYPRFHIFWLGIRPCVFVTHPDVVKAILKTSEPKAHFVYRFMYPWLGLGLLNSWGKRWTRSRRLLTPAFHYDILKSYVTLKNDLCNLLLAKFESASETGQSINVFECVSMFTLDVILQSTMSYETGCQTEGRQHPYVVAVGRIAIHIYYRYLRPWLHPDFLYYLTPSGLRFLKDCRFVHQITDDVIKKRRANLESKENAGSVDENRKRKRRDFLDTLLTSRDEEGKGLTDQEIRDEVDTFLFEGHDTTGSAISWCLYSLAGHPDIQRRVQEEVDDVFRGRGDDYLLWEDLQKLPYLTMCLKEAMRLHSPVPSIMRELTSDLDLDGYTVPKGTAIALYIYNIHHNPTVWPDSMTYDPERFSPANCEGRSPFAFVPFSAGPRNCIGQNFAMDEMRIALARIFHRYELSLDPNHQVVKREALVVKSDTDIKLRVKPRQQRRPDQ